MAVNLNPLTLAISNWAASVIDGKIRGLNPSGDSIYGSQGWNTGEFLGAGTEYFVATTGNDSNPGTEGSPFLTLAHAIAQLTPGDTLTVEDGVYNEQITPATPTQSGTTGQPITVRARNYGNVTINPLTTDTAAIEFYSSPTAMQSGWTIDGFIARSTGEIPAINVNSQDLIDVADMTNNIVIKRCGAFGSAIDRNLVALGVARCTDCLLEDVFAYGVGRKAIEIFGSYQITVRRAVGRYDYWRGNLSKPNDPRVGMSGYNTQRSLFENVILLDCAANPAGTNPSRAGLVISGNDTDTSGVSGSSDNYIVGCIVLNNEDSNGIENNGGSGNPTTGIIFKNILSWGNTYYGFNIQNNSDGTRVFLSTAGKNGLTGFRYNSSPTDPLINQELYQTYAKDNLGDGYYTLPSQMSILENNSGTGNGDPDIEPTLAPTLTSIVEPVMVPDKDRGATIIKKMKNGVETGEDLWPWPYEDVIKAYMLNPSDLATANRTVAGVGEPGWKIADDITPTSLTQYILGQTV